MTMQAYLNQEFPIGLTDLRLHPAVVAEDPGEGQDDGVEMGARPAWGLGYWRFALALLP
jgi:hypothetical protein